MNNDVLEFNEVWKTYKMGSEDIQALRGVNLTVNSGSFIAIMGPSGSGKSTLLHLAGILDTPTKGTVLLNEKNIKEYTKDEQANLRRANIGFVFQRFNLMPQLTALENVMLPMISPDSGKAKKLLDKVGLSDKYNRYHTQLSGGEQQRVSIARALANDPSLLLADEPTGELDTENARIIMELLQELNQNDGLTIVGVTHNPLSAKYADEVIRMQDGNIIS
ncbi:MULTISPECIES: ABC transporter ATP-binding protein [Methanobacterium]|jgi:putative ABC transport system ATP-binding protein|uniref:ABC transporter ATP-binding protein n=2 Tax=Methanobacterium veterum TaxID=408577 RepID=A0A9E5DLF0_9EURY|nr:MULTISPECIES: ABC transporter ATP-binding protein [Methanobacterium]MCZ3366599.1 ABC transporter ATP-binding protein [Methanobacterium veterum]MCZ3374257.1 ABC transporter ATP-binding protein [Methanobacterium veterum]